MNELLSTGSTFANVYEIVRPLSDGGMGAVYVVRHRELGDLRALKVMHPNVGRDARLSSKFHQEARVGSRIQSEHVVRVLDVGVDGPSSRPFLVMELLEGEDLRAFIRRGGHSQATIRKIVVELGHAMAAAHEAGVVHRDLKPENIFVAKTKRADKSFSVKVLDFGIAKVVADAQMEMSMAMGSPLWMAPEQAQPGHPIGPQTDVWAIGLLAFFMFTGRSFWMGGNIADSTPAAVLGEAIFSATPLASVRGAQLGVAQLLPPGFDEWFAWCVNRDFNGRFANGGAACERLAELLSEDRVSLPASNTGPQQPANPRASMPAFSPPGPSAPTGRTVIDAATPLNPVAESTSLMMASTQRPPRKSSRALPIVLGGLIVAVAATGFFLRDSLFGSSSTASGRTTTSAAAVAAESSSTSGASKAAVPDVTPAPTPTSPAVPSSDPHPVASEAPAPSTTSSAPTAPVVGTPKTGPTVPVATAKPTATAVTKAPQCDPPDRYDAKLRKMVLKPGCNY